MVGEGGVAVEGGGVRNLLEILEQMVYSVGWTFGWLKVWGEEGELKMKKEESFGECC